VAAQAPRASYAFNAADLKSLLAVREPPCVSVYLPTHRRRTEGRSDAIAYRNLCREVEKILERDVPGHDGREIARQLRSLDREEFWEEGRLADGLLVFAASGFFSAYRLPGRFPELQVVGPSFHTKPLIRFLQESSLGYYVLSLSLHRVALHEGFGDVIQEVPLHDVTHSVEDFREVPEGAARQGHRDRLSYGQGNSRDDAKADMEKFFRALGKDLWKNHLHASPRPVILAALPQHQAVFRKVSPIQTLLDGGIAADPSSWSLDEVKAQAKKILEPELTRRIGKAREEFGLARSRGQGSDSLKETAEAVVKGRVRLLLVESGRRIWGMLDPRSGGILPGDPARNAYDVDLLDEMAEITLSHGGDVLVLTKDQMPTPNGLAAVFRY
jgi:release factor family 3